MAALLAGCGVHSGPPRFPDLDGYITADAGDYMIAFDNPGRQPSQIIYFLSPGGVICMVDYWGAACTENNLPGVPPKTRTGNRVYYMDTQRGLYEGAILGYIVDNVIHGQPIQRLQPFHAIKARGSMCGVDNNRGIACKDQRGQGFILTPAWSGWLNQVN